MAVFLKRGVLAFMLTLISGVLLESQSNPHTADNSNLNTVADTLKYSDKYGTELTTLLNHLQNRGFDTEGLFSDSRFEIYEGIGDRFTKSAERKSGNIDNYKNTLGYDTKERQILDFINTHHDQLQKAEEEYEIPLYIIAAIIGIESDYGKNVGNYNPFNSYVSMYVVGYRSDFALAQLEELMEFTERKNIDVFEMKSSYAGAVSYAQFIPYSLNKWFVGEDIHDMNNNILSVANYLSYFKERTGSIEKAVLRYNPSNLYTRAVLDLAEKAEQNFTAGQ